MSQAKRTCELCGAEYEATAQKLFCAIGTNGIGGTPCGGEILPRPADTPSGTACLVCQDTGNVGITTPEGTEVRNCPRGCRPLNFKLRRIS